MRPFAYRRAERLAEAVGHRRPVEVTGRQPVQYLAGGTNLLDCMKLDIMRPAELVDLNDLPLTDIEATAEGLRLGALARMGEVAGHPAIRANYPVIAQSLELAASPQIRNMASLAGNVLQRTRCEYFRDLAYVECNKRAPGSGCAALSGVNRKHAVLGVSNRCIAAYPGDFAQALTALGATVEIAGPGRRRSLSFEALHLASGESPHVETRLAEGEIITGFAVPAGPWTRRSLYLKVRDRASYEFALASAAVALDLDPAGRVREARVALGGLAGRPWRSHEAEAVLSGRILDEATAQDAARAALAGATPRPGNGFKVELGRRTLVRALIQARELSA